MPSKPEYTPADQEKTENLLKALIEYVTDQEKYAKRKIIIEVDIIEEEHDSVVCSFKEALTSQLRNIIHETSYQHYNNQEIGTGFKYLKLTGFVPDREYKSTKHKDSRRSFNLKLISISQEINCKYLTERWNKEKNKGKNKMPVRADEISFRKNLEEALNQWKAAKKKGVIYSAPAAAFLGGEHAVVYGHLAIYYPLPLRLYVHVEQVESNQSHNLEITEYIVPDPKNINSIKSTTELTDSYGEVDSNAEYEDEINEFFKTIIYPGLIEKQGFKVSVFSSFPLAVGLNSSGAFAVCLAKALVDNFINIEKLKEHFLDKIQGSSNEIINDRTVIKDLINFEIEKLDQEKIVLLLAWMIGNCSHLQSSSGAGVHASFYGRLGKHPIIYCCSRRTHLKHRLEQGWSPVKLGKLEEGLKNLLAIKTFVFDPSFKVKGLKPYEEPPNYNVSLVYSGIFSKTSNTLRTGRMRKYKMELEDRARYVRNRFKGIFGDQGFQRSIETHISEILDQIYLNQDSEFDKNDQLKLAYQELLSETIGNVCVSMMNSVLSDWLFVPDLMFSCQYLLSSMKCSNQKIDYFVARLQNNAYKKYQSSNLPKIAAKLTGAGRGGDIIVFSLYQPDIHESLLKDICFNENVIHFDSYKMFSMQENASVKGVKKEN